MNTRYYIGGVLLVGDQGTLTHTDLVVLVLCLAGLGLTLSLLLLYHHIVKRDF